MYIKFFLLVFLTLPAGEFYSAFGQSAIPIEKKNNCEDNASHFWAIYEYVSNDRKIFIIGRLGTLEKSKKLNLHRIETVVKKLTTNPGNKGAISRERIVTAQGAAVGEKGVVEIYGDGYLIMTFELGRNEPLKLGNCDLEK